MWAPPGEAPVQEWAPIAEAPAEASPSAGPEAPAPEPAFAAAAVPAPPAAEEAWWDEPEPAPAPAAAVPQPDDEARSGRFALGGFAQGPAQEAIAAVAFRGALPAAPAADRIDLSVDGAINCDPSTAEVIAEEGFAPSTDGFTVRVRAAGPGPFMVSGTFRAR
jgi:hypothetical protein